MRVGLMAAMLCLALGAAPASAQRERADIYGSLERLGDVAARLTREFCEPNPNRILQGGLDGINAMSSRSGAPLVAMRRPSLEEFADAYGELLETAEDRATIEHAAIEGMIAAVDDRGEYYPSYAELLNRTAAIHVTLDGSGAAPIVIGVAPDGPAARAGIQVGDVLTDIDGQPVQGARLWEVRQRLQGEIDSTIVVAVERSGAPMTFTMQRAVATRETSASVHGRIANGVGAITIGRFEENTGQQVLDAIRDIRREVPRPVGYVIDLRDSPGGLLDQVIDIIDHFVEGGRVMVVRPYADCRPEDVNEYNVRRGDATERARLVVVTNAETASGAEMIAAALRELRGATLVGQTTYGNARVHTVIPLNGGRDGALKISTGVLTTPAGATWDGAGLTPDVVTEPRTATADPTMDRAMAILLAGP